MKCQKIDVGEATRRAYREARRDAMPKDSRYLTKVHGNGKKQRRYELEEDEFWEEFASLFLTN